MTGNLDTVSVADIIEAEGRRAPSHEQAQRHFRMATIVVSPKLLSPVEMTWFDRQAVFVGSDIDHDLAFPAATGYRATLDTRLDVGATAVLESAGETPDDFDLVTNYPNPFNSNNHHLCLRVTAAGIFGDLRRGGSASANARAKGVGAGAAQHPVGWARRSAARCRLGRVSNSPRHTDDATGEAYVFRQVVRRRARLHQ